MSSKQTLIVRFTSHIFCLGQFFLWCCIIVPHFCTGQRSAASILKFDHLSIEEGLSHNSVYCLLQDRYGYIWVGTQNGLNKYDGYSFSVYRSDEQKGAEIGFIGRNISALFEDRSGNLWVGTRKNGINLRANDTDKFINLHNDPAFAPIKGFDISAFFEDAAGNIWITTVGAGILKYNPRSHDSKIFTVENSRLSSNVVFDIVQDKYGTIWIAAAGGGLNIQVSQNEFALSHEMLPNHPNMGGYRKTLFLDDDFLWVGTEGTGLYKMNLKDRTYDHFAPGNGDKAISSHVVRDIHKMEDGLVYIATDGGGLNIYDPQSGKILIQSSQLNESTSLNSNALVCFLEDKIGNLWIGTFNGGLNVYKPGKTWFESLTPTLIKNEELQNRSVLSILQSRDGKIWVGTDGGGLNWLEGANSQFSTTPFKADPSNPASIGGNIVKSLYEDEQNQLWIGLFGQGLDRYDPTTNSFEHLLHGVNIWSIAARKNGRLWLGTMGEGLLTLDPVTRQSTSFRFDANDSGSIAADHIMFVFVDKDDQVWIGTADNGLDRWDQTTNQFIHYCYHPQDSFSLSNDELRSIFQDSQGRLWIGTEGGGLNRWMGNGHFECISKKDGLIANSVMGIAEDTAGMIWVSTFEGISRINPASGDIRNFDFRAMQNSNQFNQMAILHTAADKLYFGGINGLHAIQPDWVKSRTANFDLIFTDFKILNKSVPVGKMKNGRTVLEQPIEEAAFVRLSYLDKHFSIEFSTSDFTSPLENEFSFKMEGFDDRWRTTAAGQHAVSYSNLDPGNYTFRLKHKEQESSLAIYIKPPFWKTIWFRLLAALFLAGLASAGVVFLIKRKEAAHNRQILQLQNEKLATEVEAKNSKLMFSAVQIAHKNEILSDIKNDLKSLEETPSYKLRQLVHKLDRELMSEDYWEEFNLYFNQVDQHFVKALLAKHPGLTQNDIRLCSLIRINLSTKEIASLLNVSSRGVEQSRYRLKKRLNLPKDEDLTRYITVFKTED